MAGVAQATNPVDRWLGRGFAFPLLPAAEPGSPPDRTHLRLIGGMELVRQAVATILDTDPGERVMEPTFGCGLRRYLSAPNTAATRTAIRQEITEALAQWEPRIRVTDVAVSPTDDPSMLYVDIAYVRLPDLRPDNLVYPFYLS
jgi:phage baseplate assembly protein W